MAQVKSFAAAIIICLMLFGCAGKTVYVDRPVEVKVPVYIEPTKIDKPIRPALPIDTLTNGSTPSQTVEAYYNSVILLERYSFELEHALEPFVK